MADYQPKLQAQLDGSKTAGEDCVPRACSTGMDWATKGAVIPTVSAFRKRAKRLTGALNTEQAQTGLSSYDTVTEMKGMTDLRSYRKLRQPKSTLREAVSGGQYVVLFIHYGRYNDLVPQFSGDPRFQGGHGIGVLGQRVREGTVEWKVWDSVADGRRRGIAKGPDWVPRWALEASAEAFTKSNDTFSGIVIHASRKAP